MCEKGVVLTAALISRLQQNGIQAVAVIGRLVIEGRGVLLKKLRNQIPRHGLIRLNYFVKA
jgi:hypothetical protein